jgi:hypothetical protein
VAVSVDVASLNFVLIQLKKSTGDVRGFAIGALNAGGDALSAAIKKNITRKDHTLEQLAELDHPYASRHGQIQIHTSEPWVVHEQSGRMAAAMFQGPATSRSGQPSYEVGVDEQRAPHVRDVIQGTDVMLARDPLWQTALLPETQKEMMKSIVRYLGKEARSKLGVRFTGTGGGPTMTTAGKSGSSRMSFGGSGGPARDSKGRFVKQ